MQRESTMRRSLRRHGTEKRGDMKSKIVQELKRVDSWEEYEVIAEGNRNDTLRKMHTKARQGWHVHSFQFIEATAVWEALMVRTIWR